MSPTILGRLSPAAWVACQAWQHEHGVGVPVAARRRGAGRNSCNSVKSRARNAWSNLVDRGSPVSHTDPRGACALAAGTEPGATKDASSEAESWVVVVLVWVGVTAR